MPVSYKQIRLIYLVLYYLKLQDEIYLVHSLKKVFTKKNSLKKAVKKKGLN